MHHEPLSLILPTLNRPELVQICLESVRKQSVQALECIMVDQSDNEKTKEVFEKFDLGSIRKIYVFQKTKSLIQARNNGLDRVDSQAQFVLNLEDDSVLFPDYFEILLSHFKADKTKQFGGGMGAVEGCKYREDWLAETFNLPHTGNGKFLSNGVPTFPYWMKEYKEVEFLSGGNSMFRAEVIKQYRYDDRLIGYGHGDDVDISFRISRKYKMFYEPKARYYHDEAPLGRDSGKVHRKNQVQNYYYLIEKNMGGGLQNKLLFGWFLVGQILDDIRRKRKGAFIGNWLALLNIITGKIDSVSGYREFHENRKRV